MTTKVINTRKNKLVLGSKVKGLSKGTTVYSVRNELLYIVIDKGLCLISDGNSIPWTNLDCSAQFEIVDIEVHIK